MRWAMGNLPQWFVKVNIAILTPIVYLFMGKHKQICRRNFKLVYGIEKDEIEYDRMIKRCLVNVSIVMADMLYYIKRPFMFEKIIHIHHEERLIEAQKKGKGVVCVSAHMGNFPLMFMMLSKKGYKVNVIIRPMRNKRFSKFMFDLCAEWGIKMIQTVPRRRFIKETFGALKRNELLFILLDEVVPTDVGVEVDFFGTSVRRATGPFLFEKKFGSAIVPMFITKDVDNNFHIHVEPGVEGNASSEEENVSELTGIIEDYVREYPLQWGGWFNKRWAS